MARPPPLPPRERDGMNCPLSDAGFGLGGLLARGFPRPSPSSPPFCFPGGHFHVEPGQFGEPRGATFLWVPSGSRAEPQGLTHTHIHTHRRADTQTHTHRAACSPRCPRSRAPDTACTPGALTPTAHPPPPTLAPGWTAHLHHPHPDTHSARHPPLRTREEHLPASARAPLSLPGIPAPPAGTACSREALPPRQAPPFPSRSFPGKEKTPPPTCHRGRAARLSGVPVALLLPSVSPVHSLPRGRAACAGLRALPAQPPAALCPQSASHMWHRLKISATQFCD